MSIACLWLPDLYAAVEQRDAPACAGQPLVVGGDPHKGALVVSASPEARAAGIASGMEMARAQQLCPALIRRPTDLRRYREVVAQVRALLREATARSEPIALEGFYADFGFESRAELQTAALVARVRAAQRLPVRAGLGPTRFVSYLASRAAQDGGVRSVRPADVAGFIGAHPVSALWGLGPAAVGKLAEHGVYTAAELRALGRSALDAIVGPRSARGFLELAAGADRARLAPAAAPHSFSRGVRLGASTGDPRSPADALCALARELAALLEREHCEARSLRLEVQFEDGQRALRSATPACALCGAEALGELAAQLLERTRAALPVRRLRLQAGGLQPRAGAPGPQQLRLF